MAEVETQSIPREQFLVMSVNLLHRAFIESPRTKAKNLYKEIAGGKIVALTNVQMEDKSTLRFDLALDHSEFDGTLNYSAFRASLGTLLSNLAGALQKQQEITTFGAQNNPNNMIFGISGITQEKGVPAVMVLSSQVAARDAAVLLRLMYLDFQQFLEYQQSGEGAAQERAAQERAAQEGATQEGAAEEGATREGATREGATRERAAQENPAD